jgi:ABC-type transporter Mla subunit MlaD
MPTEDLLTPADLAHNRSGEPTAAELAEQARAEARVLEQSINAQTQVAQVFKDGTPEFRTAVQIVVALRKQFGEKVFEAATLRALALFGGNRQMAANMIEQWLDQVEDFARRQREQEQEPVDDVVEAKYEDTVDNPSEEEAPDSEEKLN